MPDQQRFEKIEKRLGNLGHEIDLLKKHKAHEDHSESAEDGKRTPPESFITANIAPSNQKTYNPEQQWYEALGWWIVRNVFTFRVLEGLGVIAVVIYTGLAYKQWQVARDQWRDLKHNFEVEQRAWMKPQIVPSESPTAIAEVKLINVGKSVATDVLGGSAYEIINRANPPSFFNPTEHSDFPMLFPGDSPTIHPALFDAERKHMRDFTTSEIDDLREGRSYIAIYGEIRYADQFGWHWTRYCYWRSFLPELPKPGIGFNSGACIEWNAVGEGHGPDSH